jgi:hypothetical protein
MEALDYRRRALKSAAQRESRLNRPTGTLETLQATAARLEWEVSDPSTRQPANLEVARGYRIMGAIRTDQLDLAPALEALTKAAELDTALLAESPRKAEYRLEYALTLQALGALHRRRADQAAARENSSHARTLVLELAKEHALPDIYFSLPGQLAVEIASADAMVAGTRGGEGVTATRNEPVHE